MAEKDDELVRRVERLAGVGSCSTPTFSPDGSRLAFISDLTGTPQVWTVPFEGGWPTRVTAFPDQVTNASWSPTDDLIAVEVAPGGGLDQQVYLVRSDGSDVRRLTPGGQENNQLALWSPDGRTLFIVSSRDDAARFDAFAVDIATNTWRPLGTRQGITRPNHTTPDGGRIVLTRVVARGDSNAYLLADGVETLLTPHPGQALFFAPRFVDGEVWLMADEGRETL